MVHTCELLVWDLIWSHKYNFILLFVSTQFDAKHHAHSICDTFARRMCVRVCVCSTMTINERVFDAVANFPPYHPFHVAANNRIRRYLYCLVGLVGLDLNVIFCVCFFFLFIGVPPQFLLCVCILCVQHIRIDAKYIVWWCTMYVCGSVFSAIQHQQCLMYINGQRRVVDQTEMDHDANFRQNAWCTMWWVLLLEMRVF